MAQYMVFFEKYKNPGTAQCCVRHDAMYSGVQGGSSRLGARRRDMFSASFTEGTHHQQRCAEYAGAQDESLTAPIVGILSDQNFSKDQENHLNTLPKTCQEQALP
jgi:hypothetical protein